MTVTASVLRVEVAPCVTIERPGRCVTKLKKDNCHESINRKCVDIYALRLRLEKLEKNTPASFKTHNATMPQQMRFAVCCFAIKKKVQKTDSTYDES